VESPLSGFLSGALGVERLLSARATMRAARRLTAPSDPMPLGIHDAGRLTDLAGDQPQLLFRHSEYVNLDMENVVRTEFSDNPPRDDIQILEARKNASEC
jgi:hypothetical protein